MSRLHIPAGFLWAGGKAGLKASGKADLALAVAPDAASAAAMFTTNRIAAAPVLLGREHLLRSRGKVSVLVVNAGNANCATGAHGISAAKAICKEMGRLGGVKPEQVFPSSTGVIGVPLPFERVVSTAPGVFAKAAASEAAVMRFARAIMTTDTRPKVASAQIKIGGKNVRVMGIAKGSGMIHPDMATMLAYVFTDAAIAPRELQKLLRGAVHTSFNAISVDGDTSTNDTVLLLASGGSGVTLRGKDCELLRAPLEAVCSALAEEIVQDGEGVTHVVEVHVEGAESESDARQIAKTIATSPLVKTAWAGADPNWGRMLAAAGRAGVTFAPEDVDIYVGAHQLCAKGSAVPRNISRARKEMMRARYSVRISVGDGAGRARYLSCDLTEQYVRVNSEYST